MDSILNSEKKLLGIMPEDTSFDDELVMDINGIFLILNQLGVGPEKVYKITSSENVWSEFMQDEDDLELVKPYVYLRLRLIFDPPQNATLLNSINEQIAEYEWRLNVQKDHYVREEVKSNE